MAPAGKIMPIADEVIVSKIYLVRGQKVMIDRDLAELYGVETKRLKEAVRRNASRFPLDFLFLPKRISGSVNTVPMLRKSMIKLS